MKQKAQTKDSDQKKEDKGISALFGLNMLRHKNSQITGPSRRQQSFYLKKTPLQAVFHIVDDEVRNHIVRETNKFAPTKYGFYGSKKFG